MSLKKPKQVHTSSTSQYTAAGREIQVPWDGIHKWRKVQQGDCILVKQTQFFVSFVALWLQTKREPSPTAKLSVCKSVYFPIVTYGHNFG